ncbi:fat-like cadherin-related tumor suppressor homolog [Cimex lectularius]|uniref:Cadherin domain-containing protein n=1 Tax=Cimex lectularius TaxID=79782 RepID=A0A8I6RHN1_CIMLE|nr:fat-like cadherin-related tumor suppressor homolog [Cimex lectularius]
MGNHWRLLVTWSLIGALAASGPDENTLHFKFTQPVYNVTIPENSLRKAFVTPQEKMGIVRGDVNMDVRFKIVSGDKDRFFKPEERLVGDFWFLLLRTRTGNTDVLNRERKDKYVLEIKANATKRDGKKTILAEAETTVIVTVLDVNDLNPLFYPTEYEEIVPEDSRLHESIIRVSAEDADLGRNGEIYYSFKERTEQFAISPTTGVVTLTRPLRYSEKAVYHLTVLAQDRGAGFKGGGKPSTAKLKIIVKQVNLYAPEISIHHLPDIVENSNAHIYAIVKVIDRDAGIHGEIRSLDIVDGDPDGHFRIKPGFSKNRQVAEYNIEVLKLLDREKSPRGYNLTLRAVDRGIPPRETYTSVPIRIADLNDNSPIFDREIYEVDIPESAPVNSPIIRLKVTDADQGKNAQTFLEIIAGNKDDEFYINPDTGMLYTNVKMDAELKSMYTLTVTARDQGNTGTRKQSSAKVKINVVDVNDNDPLFETVDMEVNVSENEPIGTTVAKVTAKDKDSGENSYISYSIANLNSVPFEIDHFTGVVKTTQVLDYESMRRTYVLRIRASDWGLPYRRETETQMRINLKDINDNRPQFEKVDCSGQVSRFIPIGSEIITLSAIDFDAGNIISYRIVGGNEDNCFSLDTTSGVVAVTCDLSDIGVNERVLNVTATDGTHFADVVSVIIKLVNYKRTSKPPRLDAIDDTSGFDCKDTGVARKLTEVLAASDRSNSNNLGREHEEFAMMPSRYGGNVHAPEFSNFPVNIQVNESTAIGTVLVRIRAKDRDLGYNGKLIYGISSGDSDSVFRLDPDSGELKVVGYLDRERETEYILNITVFDQGKPQKSSSRMLPITILDVNDNPPKFKTNLASFRITENALNGTVFFRVNATDIDEGDNANIFYKLITDTDDFKLDSKLGTLFVSAPLDRERQEVYELVIRATDCAGNPGSITALHSDAIIRVIVDDVNDNVPSFSLPSYTVKAREDVPVGSVIAVLSANDPDLGSGGEIRYSIIGQTDGDNVFVVDTLSGTIRITKPLDFEDRQVHSFTVRATDRGTPALSSEVTLIVEVVDVNENLFPPVFPDFVIASSVSENQPIGTLVTKVKATDADAPNSDDSRVGYSIKGGDGLGFFSIDAEGEFSNLLFTQIKNF